MWQLKQVAAQIGTSVKKTTREEGAETSVNLLPTKLKIKNDAC